MNTEMKSRLGISKVMEVCAEKNWICRELPTLDIGIDMMIEMVNEQRECINMIALQVKTGLSNFKIDSNGDYVFYFKEKHKNYWFPFQPYEDVFVRLFPWADFEIDDYYYDNDLDNYHNNECYYYSDDEYTGKISFREYREKLPSIRGVIHAGEVAFYKLHLKVNDFGNYFYRVYKMLNSFETYKGIKICKENEEE